MSSVPRLELKSGDDMPQLGFGTWNLSEKVSKKMVKKALDYGYTHIDTAESYGNESGVGEAIGDYERSELFITSKVSPSNLHYEDVLKCCEDSLDRLGTSYLDLYLVHWPNGAISIRETMWAMKELKDRGLVRNVGVSNFGINELKVAQAVADFPITVNQVEFHPWLYKENMLKFAEKNDIVITASAPLARTEVFKDDVIQELAEKYDKSPAQIVLKWELEKDVVTIPKTSSEKHMRQNFELFDWDLEPEDIERIDDIERTERVYELNFEASWMSKI
ncbi:oxidoreductase [candidate division MSBL1 archaeon SCGC-AAA259E19]|uniref:Oxidoreductase n=1 Tax=candidate division MSBL1 archaeon SCGC-AAA259E19 TaxID=1698264 RepID=A0A133UII2_9EURY|nr:oxidoreductase [candidate division MSBL1 archaeon SCGC-AAA259E19]